MSSSEWAADGTLVVTFNRSYTLTDDLHNQLEQEFRREISLLCPVEIPTTFDTLAFRHYDDGFQPSHDRYKQHMALVIRVVLRSIGLD